MEILIKVFQFILSLSLIIVLHELGHYWPAKYFKIKVEKFYLFFDVKYSLFKKKIGETEWGIGWLPLGGYVKIAGMIDESMDKEQMAKPPEPWEFRSKPSWQRLIIMLGGVTVNFILAIIIYIGLAYAYGSSSILLSSVKDGFVIDNPILVESGFKTGDKILSYDNNEINTYSELRKSIVSASIYEVERDGEILEISLPTDFLGRLSSSDNPSLFEFRTPFIIQSVSEESLNKDYRELQTKKNSMLKEMKATREQRVKRLEDSKQSLVGWIAYLMGNPEVTSQYGIEMEKMRLAMTQEKERLGAYHKYTDGQVDQPFLNSDTIKD